MVNGTSYRAIMRLVLPLAFGMANNALMQFADRVFLAHESAESLEAVLPSSMLAIVFICFFQSLCSYAGAFTAQYHGAGDEDGCRRSYRAGMVLALLSPLVFLPMTFLGEPIFRLAGHGASLVARENVYYRIVMCGAFALCGAAAAGAYLSGRGRTREVFWVNVGGNLLNVALDPLLIFGWGWIPAFGIAGAAFATVFAQLMQMLVLVYMVRNSFKGQASGGAFRMDDTFRLIRDVVRYGTPAGVYQVLNLLSFTVFLFAMSAAGDKEMTVTNAVFTISYLLFAPMEGFSIGAGILVGQYQGAKDSVMAEKAGNRTLLLALAHSAVLCTIVYILRRPVLALFAFEPGGDMLKLGETLLMFAFSWQIFDVIDTVLTGMLKGAGDTRFVMVWMLIAAFGIWLPLVFLVRAFYPVMPMFWGTIVVFVAVLAVGAWLRWKFGPWRRIKMV